MTLAVGFAAESLPDSRAGVLGRSVTAVGSERGLGAGAWSSGNDVKADRPLSGVPLFGMTGTADDPGLNALSLGIDKFEAGRVGACTVGGSGACVD